MKSALFLQFLILANAATDAAYQAGRVMGMVLLFVIPALAILSFVKMLRAERKGGWGLLLAIFGLLSLGVFTVFGYGFVKAFREGWANRKADEELQVVHAPGGMFTMEVPGDWVDREEELPGISLQEYFREK